MKIEIYPCGVYRILKVSDRLVISHLDELRLLIEGYISQGDTHIAICFAEASYLYSGAVAVLVRCFKMLKDVKGDLCILEPKPEMVDLLKQMGIDSILPVYNSENMLPQEVPYEFVRTACLD